MKSFRFIFSVVLILTHSLAAIGDTIAFSNGDVSSGIVLRTNANDLLVLTDYGAVNWPRANITNIAFTPVAAPNGGSIPRFKTVILSLNGQPWVDGLKQIPATVIDRGIMKNLPYVSFRCGDDYEVNVYGDLDQPVAVEAGVFRKLLDSEMAKSNCVNFVSGLFDDKGVKQVIRNLKWTGSVSNHGERTFEITPSTEPDSYGGWWISVYLPQMLDGARATAAELLEISASNDPAVAERAASWGRDELKLARKIRPQTITFRNNFGTTITNAEITQVNEGVSLAWRDAYGSGVVKLADLPKELRDVFDYDPEKAAAIEATESAQRRVIGEQQRRLQAQLDSSAPTPAPIYRPASISSGGGDYGSGYSGGGYTSSYRSSGGSVYVHGYYRKNGTYVQGHTRRK